jgi:inner membrane protein
MDPLTHTLVGASLAATRLGQKTRLATPALVLGANLPDIDVLSYMRGADYALAFRRGWTHGVPALVVLPALLAALLWLWGRGREASDPDQRLSPGWLLALSYLACLTHPVLDWLNTYGMRWWMPFSDTWYYGDSVFIVDPWLWSILGLGWALGRRPSIRQGVILSVLAGLVLWMVAGTASNYLPLVGAVCALILLAYFWRPQISWMTAHRAATTGLVLAVVAIASMISLHAVTAAKARQRFVEQGIASNGELMVGPMPANPMAWDILVGTPDGYRWGRLDWLDGGSLVMAHGALPAARESAAWSEILPSGRSSGFLGWVRFPWLEIEPTPNGRRIHLMDARYTRQRTAGFGGTLIELPLD